METHFSRREWLLWTLGGALAWFLFHPRGSSMAIDSLQFTSGAALFTTLQCLVLGRAVPEFRAQVLWLTSAALWLFAGIGFWMLPWRFWSESLSEFVFLGGLAVLWLATGLLQRAALRPLREGTQAWLVVPLGAACLAMLLTLQVHVTVLRAAWPTSVSWQQFFAFQGTLFGLFYGAVTGALAYAMLARRVVEHSARERA